MAEASGRVKTMPFTMLWGAALVMLFAGVRTADAQATGARGATVRLVGRVDAFLARTGALHAGLGATTDLGSYVRLDGVLAAGAARVSGVTVASGRVEIVGRFLLDPFRQSRWGFFVGSGLIARFDDGTRGQGYLTLLLGTELPGTARTRPALEVGIGGGTRVGIAIRQGRLNRR